jgi:WD40 repeat protein
VRTFDVRTLHSDRSVLLGDPDRATDVSFSPDGRWIAVTGRSGDVYLIDAAFSGFLRERIVSGAALLQAEWLDNRTVALAAADGTVTLFDAARGQPRGPAIPATGDGLPAHVHLMPVTSDELVAVSGERPGRRWSLDPMDWVRLACAVAGRDLTRPEWGRYLPDRPYRPTCTDLG